MTIIIGVSSFGFGGTNSRADVYGSASRFIIMIIIIIMKMIIIIQLGL